MVMPVRRTLSLLATLGLVATLLMVGAVPAAAASIVVNSLADNTTTNAQCTLREAVANANADADTTGGDCAAGAGADVITFVVSGTITVASPLVLSDSDQTTIVGPGPASSSLVVSGPLGSFTVNAAASARVDLLTVSGARAGTGGIAIGGAATKSTAGAGGGPTIGGGATGGTGGPVAQIANAGTLALIDVTVTDVRGGNGASGTGGAATTSGPATCTSTGGDASGGNGGDAFGVRNTGTLSVIGSTVLANRAGNGANATGGAASADPNGVPPGGTATGGDATGGDGGAFVGIWNSGTASIINTTVTQGTAGNGGNATGGSATVTTSGTATGGTATAGDGGDATAIENTAGSLTLAFVTIGPHATGTGGNATGGASSGLGATGGSATGGTNGGAAGIDNAASATWGSSIAATGVQNCVGSDPTDAGANVSSDATCSFAGGSGSVANTDPQLQPVGPNGGPTFTHAIPGTSPAVDRTAAGVNGCGTTVVSDQRGLFRTPPCDSGAYEFGATVAPPPGGGGGGGGGEAVLGVSKEGTGRGRVTSAPNGIDCGPDCAEGYPSGTSVQLTPTPSAGSVFSHWTGGCTGAGACVVDLTSDSSVTAWFEIQAEPGSHVLAVDTRGHGRVTSQPGGINCGRRCAVAFEDGTSITLSADPHAGWRLKRWRGDCRGRSATCTFTIDADTSVRAKFVRI
jgi:CSLREA domain-containing protein